MLQKPSKMGTTRLRKQRIKFYFKIAAVATLCILFISPLRNFFLSPFLPGAWTYFPTWTIIRMVLDTQHMSTGSENPFAYPKDLDLAAKQTFNLSHVKKFMYSDETDPFHDFFTLKKELSAKAETDSSAREELELMDSFQPVMTREERAQLMFTMDVFMTVCKRHNIFFVAFEGSLLGSYRHHGLVPWDDDIDVALNISQWEEARHALGNVPGFTLFAPGDSQWKFYLTSLEPFQDKPFKYPYLDLFFFRQQGDTVWGVTWGMKNHLMVEVRHFLPLTTVPWEMLQLPFPACKRRMAVANYGGHYCSTPKYVHKTNKVSYGFQTPKTECSRLHRYLPFVFRKEEEERHGKILEVLMVGSRKIKEALVDVDPDVCQL